MACCLLVCATCLQSTEISERGYWIGTTSWHKTDWYLAFGIAEFLKSENCKSVVDFGCGEGDYVGCLMKNGFDAVGYDGNPLTPEITKGLGQVLDLSEPINLHKQFDWVVSLEVGEHLPHQFERIFVENLMRHAKKGIVLSWAVKNQGGDGHFNEQNNDYIKALFAGYGYANDLGAEYLLRDKASFGYFKNTIMVFRK